MLNYIARNISHYAFKNVFFIEIIYLILLNGKAIHSKYCRLKILWVSFSFFGDLSAFLNKLFGIEDLFSFMICQILTLGFIKFSISFHEFIFYISILSKNQKRLSLILRSNFPTYFDSAWIQDLSYVCDRFKLKNIENFVYDFEGLELKGKNFEVILTKIISA